MIPELQHRQAQRGADTAMKVSGTAVLPPPELRPDSSTAAPDAVQNVKNTMGRADPFDLGPKMSVIKESGAGTKEIDASTGRPHPSSPSATAVDISPKVSGFKDSDVIPKGQFRNSQKVSGFKDRDVGTRKSVAGDRKKYAGTGWLSPFPWRQKEGNGNHFSLDYQRREFPPEPPLRNGHGERYQNYGGYMAEASHGQGVTYRIDEDIPEDELGATQDFFGLNFSPVKIRRASSGIDMAMLLSVLKEDPTFKRVPHLNWHGSLTYFKTEAPRPRQKNAQVIIAREDEGQLSVLLHRRSYSAWGSDSLNMPSLLQGCLSSIGGRYEEEDLDSSETALREVYTKSGLADLGYLRGAPKWLHNHAVLAGARRPRAFMKFKETENVDWYVLLLDGHGTFDRPVSPLSSSDITALLPELDADKAPTPGHAWVTPYAVNNAPEEVTLMGGLSRSVHQAVATLVCQGAVSL